MAQKRIFWRKNSEKMKKIEKNFEKNFFFEIDLESFETYFKTKIWISKKFSLYDFSVLGGDGGRHS